MGRKRVTKIYVFFGIGWKRGNKCRKYGMRIESIVRRGATNTHDFYDFGRVGNWLGYKDCWNRPDTIKAWVLLYHYLNLRLSNTLHQIMINNRHPRQTFIYNKSLIDMLIYDHLRGVSVVSFPGAWNLLSFDLGDNTLFTPLGNKKPLLLFHHADGQKAYDKDICFFRN